MATDEQLIVLSLVLGAKRRPWPYWAAVLVMYVYMKVLPLTFAIGVYFSHPNPNLFAKPSFGDRIFMEMAYTMNALGGIVTNQSAP